MKSFINALIICVLLPTAGWTNETLDKISSYFNTLDQVKFRFDQINADGSKAKGTLFMRRPGRARFEYDPPNDALVLASGGAIAIFDPAGDSDPDTYPLRRTPLSVVLAKNVDFKRSNFVRQIAHARDYTVVTAQDPKNPEYGSIDLYFSKPNIRFTQWITTNENGEKVLIKLGPVEHVKKLENSMFSIDMERSSRN